MKYCDLHCHSTFSDGTNTPKQLLELAKKVNLSALALTDHNTIDGLESFLQESKNYDILPIAGIEISTEYQDKSIHIVGLFLDKSYFETIKDFLKIPLKRKEESNRLLAINLNKNGYKIDYEKIKKEATRQINRVHFAKQLISGGYVDSVEKACQTILAEDNGIYIPPKRLSSFEAIAFLKSIKAVPVLAHPLLDLTQRELPDFLAKAKEFGLIAIESSYSTYTTQEQEFCEKLAKEYGLLNSGGSDFHGDNKPDIKLGIGKGNLLVPLEYATNLLTEKNKL
ncbi:MAG: PHP domain-containing protein [Clostridia bacterium]|nr:PHP domain-containing protein [Clostridia bacterium]